VLTPPDLPVTLRSRGSEGDFSKAEGFDTPLGGGFAAKEKVDGDWTFSKEESKFEVSEANDLNLLARGERKGGFLSWLDMRENVVRAKQKI